MKHFSKNLVVLVSLAFAAAGCGGGSGEDDVFTEAQAVEAAKVARVAYLAGTQLAGLDLGGQDVSGLYTMDQRMEARE